MDRGKTRVKIWATCQHQGGTSSGATEECEQGAGFRGQGQNPGETWATLGGTGSGATAESHDQGQQQSHILGATAEYMIRSNAESHDQEQQQSHMIRGNSRVT